MLHVPSCFALILEFSQCQPGHIHTFYWMEAERMEDKILGHFPRTGTYHACHLPQLHSTTVVGSHACAPHVLSRTSA
jgi:hypothetical protein